jgi:hypothetical protein
MTDRPTRRLIYALENDPHPTAKTQKHCRGIGRDLRYSGLL